MKLSVRKRAGFSLPEFMAYAAMTPAVRPYKRASRYAVALVIPNWKEKGTYMRAAAAILNPRDEFRVPDRVYSAKDADDDLDTITDGFSNHKTIVLFETEDSIPPDVRPAFDAVVHVRPPSTRQIQGVVRWAYRIDISAEQADVLGRSNWKRLKLAVMRGRPMSRVLAMLEKMKTAVPVTPVVQREAIDAIDLESMEGYGEAKVWGLDLARDIADWRSGFISWDAVDKGLLLSGPPGTGKTIFAKALAATCGMELVATSYAKWQAKGHLGDFLKAMERSFSEARRKAPAVLFLDELDAFGDRATAEGGNASYEVKAINGLLEQLDGLDGREGVVVVGACNHPAGIDPAIIRPGRLDRHIRIPLPDADARAAIFRLHLRGALSSDDHHSFAAATEGATGAEIQKMVRGALRLARRSRRAVEAEDVLKNLPPTFAVPPDVLRVNALHEIGHAVVGVSLGLMLEDVTIAGSIRLVAAQPVGTARFRRDPWERRTREHYLDLIAMMLAGMAAEQLFLGASDDGASGGEGTDLYEVTKIAIAMERSYGMGQLLLSYGNGGDIRLDDVRHLDPTLMTQVDQILRGQLDRAKGILERHYDACVRLAAELATHLEISGQDVLDAIDGSDNRRRVSARH